MTKIENVMSVADAAALGKSLKPRRPRRSSTSTRWLLALLFLVVGATIAGIGWYSMGHLRTAIPFVGDITQVMPFVISLAGGASALFITVSCVARTRAAAERSHAESYSAELSSVRAELAMRRNSEEELKSLSARLRDENSTLTRTNGELSGELEQRRQAERSLAQQRSELARSKDVLELHVQARTKQVQEFQQRYEMILNSAGEGICGLDAQGRVTFINPAAARLMAWDVKEMIGRTAVELFPEFEFKTSNATVESQPDEIVLTRHDGVSFPVEFLKSPIFEAERVVGHVLLFKDITERRQADETLTQKAAELARSNAELEQFAFVASHDLQEPLRKIQSFGDRLKVQCDGKLGEAGDYLERMQNAAARMQTLINDLLTFSRVLSRTEPFVPVKLGDITRDVLGDLEVRIEKSKAVVEVGELPTVEADPTQMRQLLQNLISNALKFHAPGATPAVRVSARVVSHGLSAGQTSLFVRKSQGGVETVGPVEFCELTVQDNGIGFDEKYVEKIFAVFQRLHGRQEYEGTGVGLAVCRRIADRHRGTITARSTPGHGATFTVTLPLHQPQPQPARFTP